MTWEAYLRRSLVAGTSAVRLFGCFRSINAPWFGLAAPDQSTLVAQLGQIFRDGMQPPLGT